MRKSKKVIPFGMYCYKDIKKTKNGYIRISICPYWSIRKGKPKQENGYCAYLGKGDWDMNKEVKWRTIYKNGKRSKSQSANELGLYMSLIWDQVKECGINEEE